jgi:hypothetical protein
MQDFWRSVENATRVSAAVVLLGIGCNIAWETADDLNRELCESRAVEDYLLKVNRLNKDLRLDQYLLLKLEYGDQLEERLEDCERGLGLEIGGERVLPARIARGFVEFWSR